MRSKDGRLYLYEQAKQAGLIEPGVEPLVDALNVDGLCSTIASCHGHMRPSSFWWKGHSEQRPFVMFRANMDFAQSLAVYLAYGQGKEFELHYCWRLIGSFYPDEWVELTWKIEIFDARLPDGWDRRLVDNDFKSLSAAVDLIVSRKQTLE